MLPVLRRNKIFTIVREQSEQEMVVETKNFNFFWKTYDRQTCWAACSLTDIVAGPIGRATEIE
jgi:hypothetical protein